MKPTKLIFAALLVITLTACNTLPKDATEQGSVVRTVTKGDSTETIKNQSDYASYLEVATQSKPMFEMTCPPQGCVILSLKVNAPVNASAIAAPSQPMNPWVAIWDRTLGTAERLGPWGAAFGIAREGFKAASQPVTTTIVTRDSNNTNMTASGTGSAVASGGTASGSAPITTTTTTTTTSNSNNRTCTSAPGGNSGTTGAAGAGGPASC